jgi:predicted neuraminidase
VAAPPSRPRPVIRETWVSPEGLTRSVHCSALSSLPGGDLLAIWYGGRREGSRDVAVYSSRYRRAEGVWSTPGVLIDRGTAERELGRPIKKVGNAVVFPDGQGRLWMVYVSVTLGGWSGSSLNVKTSGDGGLTWTPSRRLNLNPFLNLSSLVRSRPIHAADGRIGLPVYYEMAVKFPQMLWLTPDAGGLAHYHLRSLPSKDDLIQPTLIPLAGDRVLMMLRDGGDERVLHTAVSEDNGWTWSLPAHSTLPNPDAAVDAVRLSDGRLLLVYNHAEHGRDNLRLALSTDEGRTWQGGVVIESEPSKEFSYPSLVQDERGHLHLTYTWQRERIKHLEFNLAWIDEAFGRVRLVHH